MLQEKSCRRKKSSVFILMLLMAGMLTSCKDSREEENKESLIIKNIPEQEFTVEDTGSVTEELPVSEKKEEADPEENGMKEKFGENCIADQTFEVELSEYSGKVYFVPFAPSEDGQAFSIQIIQNGETLTQINPYVPDGISENGFTSLDAAAFYDVNYDGNTDIVMIETYGSTSFAAVYYGFGKDAEDSARKFMPERQLSGVISKGVSTLTIPEIRNFLSDGKKNGQFSSYGEAYRAVSRLCQLESEGAMEYNLIYVDEDDIPELAAGISGYYVSLYTYHEGTVHTLMDQWGYGAMGNVGYEYSPRKNSLRNYNTDYAGAILYTTYMTIGSSYSIDIEASLVTYNFDDVNENGMPDEDEMGSMGLYSITYMDGVEIKYDESIPCDAGGYEYIDTTMSRENLNAELEGK